MTGGEFFEKSKGACEPKGKRGVPCERTKWDEITTSKKVFSEYLLCPDDKGAEQVDRVFYYTGDYTGIENMDIGELQEVIDGSVLLWSK